MQVELVADFPVTDAACKEATGQTLQEWFKRLDVQEDVAGKRRESVQWVYSTIGGTDFWWPTTICVEYERARKMVNKKDGRIEGYNICVTKTILAHVPIVYAAWTDQRKLSRWFGKGVQAQVSAGGAFDDGEGHTGEYLRVRENKDLRFSWTDAGAPDPSLVDLAFASKGVGKAGITLQHQRIQSRQQADGLRKAWGAALEALKCDLE